MLGFYAIASPSSQPIRTDLDNEIVDARWFTRSEVQAVLAHEQEHGASMSNKVFDDDADKDPTLAARQGAATITEPPFKVPQASVVGGVLIRDWASGKFGKP